MRRVLLILRLMAFLTGSAVLLATFTPLGYWYAERLAGAWPPPTGGGTLIVPGGDMEDPQTMGLATYRRAFYARLYWRQGAFSHIVLLGRDAAPAMRKWLVYEGVPTAAIVDENESDNTLANVTGVGKLLRDWKARTGQEQPAQPLILLTSDYHCWRAKRLFTAAGIPVTVQPVPDATKRWSSYPARWGVCTDLAIETVKIAWYFGRGWL